LQLINQRLRIRKILYFVSVFSIRTKGTWSRRVEAKSDIAEFSTLDESKSMKTSASNFGREAA